MTSKKEIQQMILDLLNNPQYLPLFGLNSNDFNALKPNEIWEQHSQMPGANPNDPPIGSINSNFPKESLDNIMNIYNSVEAGDDDYVNLIKQQVTTTLQNVVLTQNKNQSSSYAGDAIQTVIDAIMANDELTQAQKEQAINDYIAGQGGQLREVPVYYPDRIDEVRRDESTGEVLTRKFGGHFGDSAGVYELIFQNTDTIIMFQDWLEANGLVEQGAFDDTRGVPSGLLRSQLSQYMAWIDVNKYVEPGTSDYANIMAYDLETDPNNPFSNSMYLQGENLKHQKMFAYFLVDYGDNHDNVISTANKARTAARFQKYMENVPGELGMEQMVENAFYSTMNRMPTKQELKDQVTLLARNYIEEFNNMNEMYAFIDNMNMIKAPNQAWNVDPNDVELQNFVDTAEQTAQETFNAKYRDDISTATYANEKMKMDEAMLKSMFG